MDRKVLISFQSLDCTATGLDALKGPGPLMPFPKVKYFSIKKAFCQIKENRKPEIPYVPRVLGHSTLVIQGLLTLISKNFIQRFQVIPRTPTLGTKKKNLSSKIFRVSFIPHSITSKSFHLSPSCQPRTIAILSPPPLGLKLPTIPYLNAPTPPTFNPLP